MVIKERLEELYNDLENLEDEIGEPRQQEIAELKIEIGCLQDEMRWSGEGDDDDERIR